MPRPERARVKPAQTANDKQRRRAEFMLSARNTGDVWPRGAPRIPEACWIASQTHSLPAPLCYCCTTAETAAGSNNGRQRALYRRRGRRGILAPSVFRPIFPRIEGKSVHPPPPCRCDDGTRDEIPRRGITNYGSLRERRRLYPPPRTGGLGYALRK